MSHESKLDSTREFKIYRRNLPHIENPESVYFITFRTLKGFPLPDSAKDKILSVFMFHANDKYKLFACVVMNDHVHCILKPLAKNYNSITGKMPVPPSECYSLAQIMHSIKSYSANQVNILLSRQGSLWQDESYDRIIRDEMEFSEKMNYIISNPVKAGLVNNSQDYKWLFMNPDII